MPKTRLLNTKSSPKDQFDRVLMNVKMGLVSVPKI